MSSESKVRGRAVSGTLEPEIKAYKAEREASRSRARKMREDLREKAKTLPNGI